MPKIIPDILLIEDQKLNQTLIQKVLMKGGFTVLAFSDGQSAYNFFKDKDLGDSSGKLIAILMDINLKDETMDGIKTTKLIRKFELEHEKDPVLIYALTSSITHENLETYKKVKMNGCIAKGELVLNRLREALSINLKDPERFVAPNDNEIILKEESLPIFSRRHSNS
ncbi:MAG: Membrane associated response regulator,histidine kinase [Francisellaceae bacterium]|nr:Membrane associated response regulator,histidine kinase [Francisellaceae bacterium]